MDLKNLTPKDKMMYKTAMESKQNLLEELDRVFTEEGYEGMLETVKFIGRAEYKRGKADGISESDKSWRETLNIMCDDKTMEGIKKSLQQIKEGKAIPLSELDSATVQNVSKIGGEE